MSNQGLSIHKETISHSTPNIIKLVITKSQTLNTTSQLTSFQLTPLKSLKLHQISSLTKSAQSKTIYKTELENPGQKQLPQKQALPYLETLNSTNKP